MYWQLHTRQLAKKIMRQPFRFLFLPSESNKLKSDDETVMQESNSEQISRLVYLIVFFYGLSVSSNKCSIAIGHCRTRNKELTSIVDNATKVHLSQICSPV